MSNAEVAAEAGATVSGALDLVVRAERAYTPEGVRAVEVGVHQGRIVAVEALGAGLEGARVVDVPSDQVLLPGLVDSHVHVNEPGRTEWEGFASATRAAAAGGVTTIIDMPLNSIPPTVTVDALNVKRAVAGPKAFVNVGFWGGAIPGNLADMRPLLDQGVFGFKCFLLHSGVDEFPSLTADEMQQVMEELEPVDGLLIVHAEDAHIIDSAPQAHGQHYSDFLASRPRDAEDRAIADVIERAKRTGARAHILHLSNADSIERVRQAKADGVRLTVETCPHYLTLVAEEVPDGATAFKCCPPIREESNRDALWAGLLDGTIDIIVSDHSPATAEVKGVDHGDFGEAWGGVASLQLGLPLVWSEARRRGVSLEHVLGWMATKTSAFVGLESKGKIAVGADADLAFFAPEQSFVVDARALRHKNPVTPYDGRELFGVVHSTLVAGREVDFETPTGQLLSAN
ncbi:allantoinase AllB [Galactobacter caseinivorans]|uniref:allantoinase n=1 Tax=Galactobacter caseinivorans TaxID=2676123 RepID=A0A496PJ88_9MICC|nr:allantoinase AllB [Galactobacter caseinivorans]RKW70566.1 allantoinase AllB [Galactobacter caseinivorans]